MKFHDIQDDRGHRTLFRLLTSVDAPSYVKQSSIPTQEEIDAVSVDFFADPDGRKFPCHTKASTYLNHLFWMNQRSAVDPKARKMVDGRFAKLSDYWGNKPELDAAQKQLQKSMAPTKAASEVYVLHVDNLDTGITDKLLPVKSASDACNAVKHLSANAHLYPLAARKEAARRILRMGYSLPADVTDSVEAMAGLHPAFPSDMAVRLEQRAFDYTARKDHKAASMLRKLAASLANAELKPSEKLSASVADVVAKIDVDHWTGPYVDSSDLPERLAFEPSIAKWASVCKDHMVRMTDGSVWAVPDLLSVGLAPFRASEDGLAEELSGADDGLSADPEKLAEVLSALPRPVAVKVSSSLKHAGIRPVTSGPVNSLSQLQQLAARVAGSAA